MTPADSRRIRLVSDAVVANYILDSRHAPAPGHPTPPRRPADRLDHTRRALRRREDRVHARRDHAMA